MSRLLLLALALLTAAPAFAATGIFQTYVILDRGAGSVYFEGSGSDDNSVNPLFQTFFFAPTATGGTFTLRGAQVKTFKNGTGDVFGAQLFYRVYAQGTTAPAFTQLNLPFASNDGGGNQTWQAAGETVNLTAACGTGNVCTLEFYFLSPTNEGDRFDNNGGANYTRPYGVAPFSSPVADVAGYRLLSAPMTGVTVGALAGINLVQGVPAGTTNTQPQYPLATPNLYVGYDGTSNGFGGYIRPASVDTEVVPGKGFFWQWYDLAFMPPNPENSGGGTSTSRELSTFTLAATGNFVTTTQIIGGFAANGTAGTSSGFHMIGNPFVYPLLSSGVTANQPLQTTFQAWQPSGLSAGTYQPILSTQALQRWQGVFAEISTPSSTAPTFTFNAQATTALNVAPGYYRSTTPHVHLSLSGTTEFGTVADEAAYVRMLPDALVGWDPNDASKLLPPNSLYALISPILDRDGAPYRTAVNSLPDDGQSRTVPVAFVATAGGDFSLTWEGPSELPQDWRAELHDTVTGTVVNLRTATTYTFTSDATDWTDRFELLIVPSGAVAGEGNAATTSLSVRAPRPNPVRGSALVTVEIGETQAVRADLYDALGRRVQSVYDATAPAGTLSLRLDVSALAPGVYVLRVDGTTASATQTVTVVR